MHWRDAKAVPVLEEQDALALSDSSLRWLDPLAPAGAGPEALDESESTTLNIGAIVLAHDRLDSLAGLVGVVEGDCADVVVKDVGLDDAVEELTTDETEFTIDGCSRTADIIPAASLIVRKGGIGMLEVGDGNYMQLAKAFWCCQEYTYRASG